MAKTMESAVFMGKNYQNNHNAIANTTDLTHKQMFDISSKLVSEQDEISGLETIGWENHSWKYLSLIGVERIINLQRTKIYVFSDSVLCLGKSLQNPESNEAWEQRLGWIKSSQSYRNFDRIDPENFTERILFMSMFNDITFGTKENETECLANAKLVSLYAKKFGKTRVIHWSWFRKEVVLYQ